MGSRVRAGSDDCGLGFNPRCILELSDHMAVGEMSPADELVVVEVAGSQPEAEMLCALLRSAGIACMPRLTRRGGLTGGEADEWFSPKWDSRRLGSRSLHVGRVTLIAAVTLAVAASIVGCAGSQEENSGMSMTRSASRGAEFVGAPKSLIAACHKTASDVGYRVPCPMKVPDGLTQTGRAGRAQCTLHIIGAGGVGACATSWRGWVVGSSTTPDEHLVITASPTPVRSYAKVVNGPAWYRGARVEPLGWITVDGWRTRAEFVPPDTNEGSAFAHHVALIWTVGMHSYAIGFHDVRGVRPTLKLDKELVDGVKLVGP
jgi:hypothetical protein